MFNFMKKGVTGVTGSGERGDRDKQDRDEKERRKRDKKLRKLDGKQGGATAATSGTMSSEELHRLDEVRRSLKIRSRRKEKEKLPSGITADYSADFFANLDLDRGVEADRGNEEVLANANTTLDNPEHHNDSFKVVLTASSPNDKQNSFISSKTNISQSDSSETSLHSIGHNKGRVFPPIPPKPPKRGILKGPRHSLISDTEEMTGVSGAGGVSSPEASILLVRNTLQNEIISYKSELGAISISSENVQTEINSALNLNNLHLMTSPSPSAESLTDTTNSSFATPPFSLSPVGESQGTLRWSRVQLFEDKYLPLPAIKLVNLPAPRELVIQRQKAPRHDFGFSLRKAICLDRTESLVAPVFRPVIFAEPGAGGDATGLLPGDRLLKVNGISVEELPRESIIEMIRTSGDSVTVQVQPVAELVELSRRCMTTKNIWNEETERSSNTDSSQFNTLKRSASKRFKNEIKHDEHTPFRDGESCYLVYRGGFCEAIRLPIQADEPGKAVIQLLHNDEQLTVDEDDIEKSNSPALNLVEDICQIKHLNEASVLNCLRQRYASNLIHTKAGPVLLIANPMAPLSLYSEKVVSMFRGCKTEDMPPHIYSLAQTSYRRLIETRRDQSLVFMGRSGSGKTTSFKHALYYLVLAAGSVNQLLTAEKVHAINTILESFGNTKTCLNSNATRFAQILSLDFDQSGLIASASLQVMLLERERVGRRLNNDQTFHVLHRLLAGAEGNLQKELLLDNITFEESNLFVQLSQKLEEREKCSAEFIRIVQAFNCFGFDPNAVKAIWCVLAAIFHLGVAGVVKTSAGRIQFANALAARKTSTLLGVSVEALTAAAFSNLTPGSDSVTVDTYDSAWESLETLVVGLYSEVMSAVVSLINKAICAQTHTIASILLVDSPGFQNPASCGNQMGATLSDLKYNYLQERLQMLFHHVNLVAPKDRYEQELVEIDVEGIVDTHPVSLVSLLDKTPQSHVVRTSQRDIRGQDRRGLLWLLDEEAMYPNANDDSFLERLFTNHCDRDSQMLLRRAAGSHQFILQHLQGTNPVLYSANGWLKASIASPMAKNATTLLQDSSKPEISRLFIGSMSKCVVFCGSMVGLDGNQSLRRMSSIRRSFTSTSVKRNSVMLQVKFTVDGIIDTLRRTETHFVHCFLLQHNAGTTSLVSCNAVKHTLDDVVNVPLLRSQLRGSQILEAARLHRLGFPEAIPLAEFGRRFGLLGDVNCKENSVAQILATNEIDPSGYRIGSSQVLFRCGVLCQLEAKRDELLSDRIIQFQSCCRGFLVRKHVAQRRIQVLAVRCIQRNVRAFMRVRDWPWWRLLVRVTPLLNVHRTEEQLKMATDELATLKLKLERVEADRAAMKAENSRLEIKLSEMNVDLSEERSTANHANERLESETAERLRLEKDVHEQKRTITSLQEMSEKLEMDLICAKSDLNGLSEDEEHEGGENDEHFSAYKLKYERAAREIEFIKRRLQTQHEHDLEQLIALKKQLEKKLADAYEEVEEQRQVVGQWKRKVQKMTYETNDLRMLLEEQNGRNNMLEKRQRKFDSECQALQDVGRQERVAKERLSREKDVLIAEKFTMEQNLADLRLEFDLKEEKLSTLQREFEEMSFNGGTEEEIAQLKRSKMDFERKCKELEEELDEMAGQVQLLEQTKLRLEMTLETMRKEARREAQQRDDELEEVRGSACKKIKALECQLETEHEERTFLLREKHELERRLQSTEERDRTERAEEEATIQKLKRDLRKYRALLKDAQSQLERVKVDTPGKSLIRQLRNQLDDAETAKSIAIKSRQAIESDLNDVQLQLEETQRARAEAEERAVHGQRDRVELQAQIEENEEETAELMKKYRAAVKQLNIEQMAMSEYEMKFSEVESEKKSLKDQLADMQTRLDNVENMTDSSVMVQTKRLELRTKELESRLELEQATRTRLELQTQRQKDALERAQVEVGQARTKEAQLQDANKKVQKSLRDLREEFQTVANREQESVAKRKDMEKKMESVEAETSSVRNDLRLALQRIADLQHAMEEDDENPTDSDDSDETDDSLSDSQLSSIPIRANKTSVNRIKENGVFDTPLVINEDLDNNTRQSTGLPNASSGANRP